MKNATRALFFTIISLFILVASSCITPSGQKQSVTFVFESCGGSDVASVEISDFTNVKLESPVLEGHTFKGWYYDSNYKQEVKLDSIHLLKRGVSYTVYAKWDLNSYSLLLKFENGLDDISIKFAYGEQLILPIPTKEGYSFSGWFENSKLFSLDKMPARDVTLTARYDDKMFRLSFNTVGAGTIESSYYYYNQDIELPTPSKVGYTFSGWYFNDTLFDQEQMPNYDVDLVAKWSPNPYSITFSDDSPGLIVDFDAVLDLPVLSKTGYKFLGYFENDELFTLTKMPARNVYLTIKWEAINYTIKFNSNGGNVYSDLVSSFEKTITLPIPSRLGYTFTGWYENDTLFESTKMPDRNLVLDAKWSVNTYTIAFNPAGGTPVPNMKVKYLETFELPHVTRSGYTFLGWFEGNELFIEDKMPSRNITLIAKWEVTTFTITIDNNNGTEKVISKLAPYADLNLTTPVKEGYNFDGYLENGELFTLTKMPSRDVFLVAAFSRAEYKLTLDGVEYRYLYNELLDLQASSKVGHTFVCFMEGEEEFTLTKMPSRNLFLTSKYSKNEYKIKFDAVEYSFKFDELIEFPEVTKTGHSFVGWYELGKQFVLTNMPARNIELTSKFNVNSYQVMFDDDCVSFEYNTLITYKPIEKTGYTFKNWLLDGVVYELGLMGDSDLVLTSLYEINTYSLYLDEEKTSYKYQEELNLKHTDIIGYTFVGWYLNEELFTETTMPANDLHLESKYQINTYTLTIDEVEYIYEYNQTLDLIAPSKDGYTFNCFKELDTIFELTLMPAREVYLTTVYTINSYKVYFDEVECEFEYLQEIIYPELTKLGYTFDGWYLDSEKCELTTMPCKDLQLKSRFIINSYTIKFDEEEFSFNYQEEIVYPEVTKDGNVFLGWYNKGILFDLELMPDYDIELVSRWELDSYTVNFNYDDKTISKVFKYQEEIVYPVVSKTGYTFVEWLNKGLSFSLEFMPNNDLELDALFTINSYTISFDGVEFTYDYNQKIDYPDSSKTGYSFNGWFNEETLFDNEFMPDYDVCLTSSYTINSYTISFDGEISTLKYNELITYPVVSKVGHTFIGWYSGETLFDLENMPANNISLVSKYSVNSYTISFDGTEYVLKYDQKITYPDTSKVGYSFNGWYLGEELFTLVTMPAYEVELKSSYTPISYSIYFDGVETKYLYQENIILPVPTKVGHEFVCWVENDIEFTLETMPARNIYLISVYTVNKYTISFSDPSLDPITLEYNKPITLTALTKVGHNFLGYFENDVLFKLTAMPARDVYLTPKFEAKEYNLAIEDETITKFKFKYGEELNLASLVKEGYTFLGYFENDQLFTDLTMPARNIVLIAKWSINSYTISFSNVSLADIVYHYNAKITLPVVSKEGYTFDGYYELDKLFDLKSMPARDVILTAKYSPNTYKLFVDGVEFSYLCDQEISLDTPSKVGHSFVGYYEGETLFELTTMPARDVYLYAKYDVNTYKIYFDEDVVEFTYLSPITLLEVTKVGYTFDGWYYLGSLFELEFMPAHDIYLVSKFKINTYTLIIDGVSYNYSYNTKIVYPQASKYGYTFVGYFEDGVKFECEYMPAYNPVIVSVYTPNEFNFTIKTLQGDVLESQILTYGTSLDFSKYQITGYNLALYSDLEKTVFKLTSMPNNDVVVYIELIPITFAVNYVYEGYTDTVVYPYGSKLDLSNKELEDGQIIGYYSDKNYLNRVLNHTLTTNTTLFVRVIPKDITVVSNVSELEDALESSSVIFMYPGLYEVNLVITKPVTLLGNNFDNPVVRRDETVLTPINCNSVFEYFDSVHIEVASSDVTFNGLVFDGNNPNVTNIWTKELNDRFNQLLVDSNKLENANALSLLTYYTSMINIDLEIDCAVGIYVNGQKGKNTSFRLTNSIVQNYSQYGVIADNELTNDNLVKNNEYIIAYVLDNTFNNIRGLHIEYLGSYYGMLGRAIAFNSGVYGYITNNIIKNSTTGVDIYNTYLGNKTIYVDKNEFIDVNNGIWINCNDFVTQIYVINNSFIVNGSLSSESNIAIAVSTVYYKKGYNNRLVIKDNYIENYRYGIATGYINYGCVIDIINNNFNNIHDYSIYMPATLFGYSMNGLNVVNIHENQYNGNEKLFIEPREGITIINSYLNNQLVDTTKYGVLSQSNITYFTSPSLGIKWNKVIGADGYNVYINGVIVANITGVDILNDVISYNFDMDLTDAEIRVECYGDNLISDFSNTLNLVHIKVITVTCESDNQIEKEQNYYILKDQIKYSTYLVDLDSSYTSYLGWTLNNTPFTFEQDDCFTTSNVYERVELKNYTVTYILNDQEINTEVIPLNELPKLYLTIELEDAPFGYTTYSWYLDNQATIPYTPTGIKSDLVLYAVHLLNTWNINYVSTITISKEVDENVTYNSKVDLFTPQVTGFKFLGWYTDSELTTKVSLDENNLYLVPNNDTTLYASWETLYQVTYDLGGLASLVDNDYYSVGDRIVAKDPLDIPKYTFAGMYYDSNFTLELSKDEFNKYIFTLSEGGLTVYLCYIPLFDIIYVSEYGDISNQTDIQVNSKVSLNNTLVSPYHFFDGWYLDKEFKNPVVLNENGLFVIPNNDTTLYAKWVNKYRVNYEVFGHSDLIVDENYYLPNSTFELIDPTNIDTNFIFMGWYTDEFFTNKLNSNVVNSDVTLFGLFYQYHTLSFSTPYGRVNSQSYYYTQKVTLDSLTEPSKTFIGWYLDSNFLTEANFEFSMVDHDQMLFARWIESDAIIVNNGESIQEAINNANENDIIFIRSGAYFESLVIDKPITLLGNNFDGLSRAQTIIYPINITSIHQKTSNAIIRVVSPNVTINGLTVDGNNPNVSNIWSEATHNEYYQLLVTNNKLDNLNALNLLAYYTTMIGKDLGIDSSIGIYVDGQKGLNTNFVLTNSIIQNYSQYGVQVYNSLTTNQLFADNEYIKATITNNTFNNILGLHTISNGEYYGVLGRAVSFNTGTSGDIINNTFNNCTHGVDLYYVYFGNDEINVIDNQFINVLNGIWVNCDDFVTNINIINNSFIIYSLKVGLSSNNSAIAVSSILYRAGSFARLLIKDNYIDNYRYGITTGNIAEGDIIEIINNSFNNIADYSIYLAANIFGYDMSGSNILHIHENEYNGNVELYIDPRDGVNFIYHYENGNLVDVSKYGNLKATTISQVNKNEGSIKWNRVVGADGYRIYINNTLVADLASNDDAIMYYYFDMDLTNVSIYVQSYGQNLIPGRSNTLELIHIKVITNKHETSTNTIVGENNYYIIKDSVLCSTYLKDIPSNYTTYFDWTVDGVSFEFDSESVFTTSAVFVRDQFKHLTVTYKVNNVTVATETVTLYQEPQLYKTLVVEEAPYGYTTYKWYLANNTNNEYIPTGITNSFTMYAVYVLNTWNVNYSSEVELVKYVDTNSYNKAITLLKPTATGYIFHGWFMDSEFTIPVTLNEKNQFVIPNNDTTLFAKWEKLYQVTVEFNIDVNYSIATYYSVGALVSIKSIPGVTKYKFAGLFYDEAYTLPLEKSGSTYYVTMIEGGVTVFGLYDALYDVTYVTEYGTAANKTGLLEGTEYTLVKNPTDPNHFFAGWYTDSEYTTPIVLNENNKYIIPNHDTTLFAKWEAYHQLSFNTPYGSVASKTAYHTQSITLSKLTSSGKTFVGWYMDSEFMNPVDYTFIMIDNDCTLYARWIECVATIVTNEESIQAALDNANEYSTIFIMSGMYYENLVISKPVTILGNNYDNPTNRRSESIIVPFVSSEFSVYFSGAVIEVIASDVTINGIVVDGDNPLISRIWTQSDLDAFYQLLVDNNRLENEVAMNLYNYYTSMLNKDIGIDCPVGIYVSGNKGVNNNFTLLNSKVLSFSQYGVMLYNSLTSPALSQENEYLHVTISNNVFDDIRGLHVTSGSSYVGSYGRAISFHSGVNGVVSNNLFTNSTCGIDLYYTYLGVETTNIINNEFENVTLGIWNNMSYFVTTVTIESNSFIMNEINPFDLLKNNIAIAVTAVDYKAGYVNKMFILNNYIKDYQYGIASATVKPGCELVVSNNSFNDIKEYAIYMPAFIFSYDMKGNNDLFVYENEYNNSNELLIETRNGITNVYYYEEDVLVNTVSVAYFLVTYMNNTQTIKTELVARDSLPTLEVDEIPDGYQAVWCTNKQLTVVYNNTPITKATTLYLRLDPIE